MMITVTEFRKNLGKYLALSRTEDIYITQYGQIVSRLTNPLGSRVDVAESLFGILPNDVSVEDSRADRLLHHI